MVHETIKRFCTWLGWRPTARDQSDEAMIHRLVAEGRTAEEARALLDSTEEAEIDEFLREKFPIVKRK